jgi:hypothetical protein
MIELKRIFLSKIICILIKEHAGSASSAIGVEDGFSFKKGRMMRT